MDLSQVQPIGAMSSAALPLSAGGVSGKDRKPPCCPHCKDPVKNHPKPTCSQLMAALEDMGIAIKNEGPDAFQRLALSISSAGVEAAPTDLPQDLSTATVAPSSESIRRLIRVSFAHHTLSAAPLQASSASISNHVDRSFPPESISGWSLKPSEFKFVPPMKLEGHEAVNSLSDTQDEETKEVLAHQCVCQVATMEELEPEDVNETSSVTTKGAARVFMWAYWVALTTLRVVRYLAVKALQFLVLACAVVLLFDMLMELRQAEQYYRY
ncbi:hypothetical protein BKA70DRAFT_1431347 [Coprinopsis sp. MPI-PUGE-AT-0042]|nr:hypothetical protein BKA70DRAFT_1431347 [Coprinopsis sp. MPI-PUGE-AT-0042]